LKFIKVYGDSSPSFSTIKKWAAEFKRGRTRPEDDPRAGRPKSATTPEIIEQVHDMISDGRRMKVHEISETIGISKERVGYIFPEEFVQNISFFIVRPRTFQTSPECKHTNKNKYKFSSHQETGYLRSIFST